MSSKLLSKTHFHPVLLEKMKTSKNVKYCNCTGKIDRSMINSDVPFLSLFPTYKKIPININLIWYLKVMTQR